MAFYNVYCKRDITTPTDILVKNGDGGDTNVGWFSSSMEFDPAYELNVYEGDVIKIQLIENSGIWSLDDIIIKNQPDAFSFFVDPLVKTIGDVAMGPKPCTAITCTVKQGATNGRDGYLDYLIKYSLIGDGLTSTHWHDPKIRINSK